MRIPLEKMDIQRTVQRAQRGDREAFSHLADHYTQRLRAFLQNLTHDGMLAEDLSQEALLRAYTHLQDFDASQHFTTWLYAIAKNLAISGHRRGKMYPCIPLDQLEYEPAARETDQHSDAHRTLSAVLANALQRLPAMYREAFYLSEVQEWGHRAIAEALDLPIGTVKSRVSRARKLLRRYLLSRHRDLVVTYGLKPTNVRT